MLHNFLVNRLIDSMSNHLLFCNFLYPWIHINYHYTPYSIWSRNIRIRKCLAFYFDMNYSLFLSLPLLRFLDDPVQEWGPTALTCPRPLDTPMAWWTVRSHWSCAATVQTADSLRRSPARCSTTPAAFALTTKTRSGGRFVIQSVDQTVF